MITIVIPTYNEHQTIFPLLSKLSLVNSISEILVVDGGSTDNTIDIVFDFIASHDSDNVLIKLIRNPLKIQSSALNIGFKNASNDIVIRLDAHIVFNEYDDLSTHFNHIIELLRTNRFCNIGFRQRFAAFSILQYSLYFLSCSPFLSLFKDYRYANSPTVSFVTTWLFSIKKSIIKEQAYFRCDLPTNEDFDFNQRLITSTGLPLLIYPNIPIYYIPRSSLFKLAIQYFHYGSHRQSKFTSDLLNYFSAFAYFILLILIFLCFCLLLSIPGSIRFCYF